MAILEYVPGIKIAIQVGGVDCVEYDDPDPEDEEAPSCPTSTKYIESITDAEFAIHYVVGSKYFWGYKDHTLTFYIYIDGKRFSGFNVRPRMCVDKRHTSRYTRLDSGSWVRQKPRFSAVRTVDHDTKDRVAKDRELAKSLGLITVEVRRTIEKSPLHKGSASQFGNPVLELTKKALKGKEISHGTVLSPGDPIREPLFTNNVDIPEDNGPIAVFRFKDRSKEALKRELVIPQTPSQSPAPPTGLVKPSPGELQRLTKEKLRDLKSETEAGKKPVIKRDSDEVFDLTQDDAPARKPTKARKEPEFVDLTHD